MSLPLRLASLLAHELEPGLLSIEARLRSLLKDADTRGRSEIENCLREMDGLRAVVRDVLILKTTELECKPFALSGVLESIERRFSPIAREEGIALDVPSGGGDAVGNARATERALANLVDNAIKFSSRGSAVAVRVSRARGRVELAVTDRGPGVPATERERIFEPFVRAESHREARGSGLGLAIARTLARAQGGDVTLISTEGGGSRFLLTLLSSDR